MTTPTANMHQKHTQRGKYLWETQPAHNPKKFFMTWRCQDSILFLYVLPKTCIFDPMVLIDYSLRWCSNSTEVVASTSCHRCTPRDCLQRSTARSRSYCPDSWTGRPSTQSFSQKSRTKSEHTIWQACKSSWGRPHPAASKPPWTRPRKLLRATTNFGSCSQQAQSLTSSCCSQVTMLCGGSICTWSIETASWAQRLSTLGFWN